MTASYREKIRRQLAKRLPEFRTGGKILYMPPVEDVLRGLLVEGSSDPTVFYLWAFVQPMFIPCDHVVLTDGFRLRSGDGSDRWSTNERGAVESVLTAVRTSALPFLERVDTVALLARHISVTRSMADPRRCEELAACLARSGRQEEAFREWSRIDSLVDSSVTWQADVKKRVKHLEALFRSNTDLGQHQLDSWAEQTRRALKIEHEQ